MVSKPMLAGRVTDLNKLKYPLLATPKLDGIRCLIREGKAVSRNFKPIANSYLQSWLSKLPEGLDGELIVPDEQFNKIISAVMSEDGEPTGIKYYAFDYVKRGIDVPYEQRMADLRALKVEDRVIKVLPVLINNEAELLALEVKHLSDHYEGVMIRSVDGPYKEGRSTEKEGYLLKLKRFEDSEARILACEQRYHNANEATKDAFGHTKHSSHKDGMEPMNMLGNLTVRDLKTDVEFNLGSGYDEETRIKLWKEKDKLIGKIVKYKFQACGTKDRPRFPIFLGFRDKRDF